MIKGVDDSSFPLQPQRVVADLRCSTLSHILLVNFVLHDRSKKDILTSFKRPKWHIKPNNTLHFKMLSRLSEQQTKIM